MTIKRKRLSLREKLDIVVESERLKISTRMLAEQFGIGKTQVTEIIKNKAELTKLFKGSFNPEQKRKFLKTEGIAIDQKVYDWFANTRKANVRITGREIKDKALEVAGSLELTNFKASNGWVDKFCQRHRIDLKAGGGNKKDYKTHNCQRNRTTSDPKPAKCQDNSNDSILTTSVCDHRKEYSMAKVDDVNAHTTKEEDDTNWDVSSIDIKLEDMTCDSQDFDTLNLEEVKSTVDVVSILDIQKNSIPPDSNGFKNSSEQSDNSNFAKITSLSHNVVEDGEHFDEPVTEGIQDATEAESVSINAENFCRYDPNGSKNYSNNAEVTPYSTNEQSLSVDEISATTSNVFEQNTPLAIGTDSALAADKFTTGQISTSAVASDTSVDLLNKRIRAPSRVKEVKNLQHQFPEFQFGESTNDPLCNRQFLMTLAPFMSRMPLNVNLNFRTQIMGLTQRMLNQPPMNSIA